MFHTKSVTSACWASSRKSISQQSFCRDSYPPPRSGRHSRNGSAHGFCLLQRQGRSRQYQYHSLVWGCYQHLLGSLGLGENLPILTVVGGEYRLKEDHSATTTKKQILIHFIKHYFTTALRNIIYLLLSRDFLIRCDMSDLFQDTL